VGARETAIGIAVTSAAIVAMWFDHMRGDDPGYEDPPAFFISAGICLLLAGVLFGYVVPRARSAADRAATRGAVIGVIAVLSVATVFLGIPWIVGGAALALGLAGLEGDRRRLAALAIALGVLTLCLCVIGTDWGSES
jgi:hypothetical protein